MGIIVILTLCFLVLSVLSVPLLGRVGLPHRPALPVVSSILAQQDAPLDKWAAMQYPSEKSSDHAGFRLLNQGEEALIYRIESVRMAQRSVDIQVYIWRNDACGRSLVHELILAANRGVRIRLLLDDLDARNNNFAFAGLDQHPNIEIRIFNPFTSRQGLMGQAWESLMYFNRVNHRMHNKTWIVDNRLAIAGGRNIGNEYFGGNKKTNFMDADFAIAGDAVTQLSHAFDEYWNCVIVYPLKLLNSQNFKPIDWVTLLKRSEELSKQDKQNSVLTHLFEQSNAHVLAQHPFVWTSHYSLWVDSPLKAVLKKNKKDLFEISRVFNGFYTNLSQTKETIELISPYFVPGKRGTQALVQTQTNGRQITILTNSLAANDVASVHGGYSKYRQQLVKANVKIFELKATSQSYANFQIMGSSGASLHTKAAIFDGLHTFVGSFNLDPRSLTLNCEQGIFVTHKTIATQMQQILKQQTHGEFSWQLGFNSSGELTWMDNQSIQKQEPNTSLGRKIQAFIFRMLPLDKWL